MVSSSKENSPAEPVVCVRVCFVPAFLACGENDRLDISQGLPELYLAMKKAGVSAELHVYTGVGHGFGVRETTKGPVAAWPSRFLEWMGAKGFLAANGPK